MNLREPTYCPPRTVTKVCGTLALLGLLALFVGIVFAPRAAWGSLLLASYFLVGLGLAGVLLVALHYVTSAGWGVALRRVPEAMTAALPLGAAGLALVFLAQPSLYPWTDPGHASGEHAAPFKHFWLNWPFFLGRAAVYLGCWYLFARAIVRTSRRQDEDGNVTHTRRNVRLSAGFLVVFAVTCWLASYDWVMSLEPEWYSTVLGLYNFAGLFLGGLAAVTLLVLWLQRLGPFRKVLTEEHLHDLGKLLFAFSTFWMYIWFCQYMLIWYVNNPEETVYYTGRMHGAWEPLFWLNVILNWVVPFVVLLPREAKRSPGVLTKVGVVLLVGRGLDLFLMILPPLGELTVLTAVVCSMLLAGAIGLFCLAFFSALGRAPLVPLRDPLLVESISRIPGLKETSGAIGNGRLVSQPISPGVSKTSWTQE
jgi:hypothetical protein